MSSRLNDGTTQASGSDQVQLPALYTNLALARRNHGGRADKYVAFLRRADPLADAVVEAFALMPEEQWRQMLSSGHLVDSRGRDAYMSDRSRIEASHPAAAQLFQRIQRAAPEHAAAPVGQPGGTDQDVSEDQRRQWKSKSPECGQKTTGGSKSTR